MRVSSAVVVVVVVVVAGLAACGDNIKSASPPDGSPPDGSPPDGTPITCGNGVVDDDLGELCDTGIAGGAGACPTSCDDGIACTADTLDGAGTCRAACVFPPITAPADGDGCCPPGAHAANDDDCTPVCGNGVTEPGEECDDGNTNNKDGCSNNCRANLGPVAFRFADLDLRDPHVYVAQAGCIDLTDNTKLGSSINGRLQAAINADGTGDGMLDLSPTLVFRAFSQTAPTTPVELHFATCTAPTGSTSCTANGGAAMTATASNRSAGQCLSFLPGTVRPYTPAITSTNASCFVTDPVAVTLDLAGIPLPLEDVQVAAHYVGFPADVMASGLLRGFLSEAAAAATMIPLGVPVIGGQPLGAVLAGGGGCPSFSDQDTHDGVSGWWFYLNFSGNRATWVE